MTRIQEDLIRINIAAAMRQAADMGLQGVSEEKMALLMQVFNVEVHDNGTGISLEGIVPVYEDIITDADTIELVSIGAGFQRLSGLSFLAKPEDLCAVWK